MKRKWLLCIMTALSGMFATNLALALDWQKTTIPDTATYEAVVSSADGKTLVAAVPYAGVFYSSTNAGVSWTSNNAPFSSYSFCLACSADGAKLAVGVAGGVIWTSADTGASWLPSPVPATNWVSIGSSASGQTLVATFGGDRTYSSQDWGANWTSNLVHSTSVASSADGTKLAAAAFSGGIVTSTNSGVTWQMTSAPSNDWVSLACSADGVKLVAGNFSYLTGDTNRIYISTNSGAAWTPSNMPDAPQDLVAIASSADGKRLVVLAAFPFYPSTPQMYVSVDGRATWTKTGPPDINWTSMAMSADGYQIVASAGPTPLTLVGNGIYISKSVPELGLSITPQGTNRLLSWTTPFDEFCFAAKLRPSRDELDRRSRPTSFCTHKSCATSQSRTHRRPWLLSVEELLSNVAQRPPKHCRL